ncbi:hypothetical protein PSP6_90016 [Paraburkholderia tropica]|nr:hypothetical protein PSP6_90016 [Paraburkholderia tropica]
MRPAAPQHSIPALAHESHADSRHAVPAKLLAARLRSDEPRRRRRSRRRPRTHRSRDRESGRAARKGPAHARPPRSLRGREGAGRQVRRAHRRPAGRRTLLDRSVAGAKRALRLRSRAGVRAGSLAYERRDRAFRRRGDGGLSLPRAHAGPRGVLQPAAPARAGRRRAVRRIDRPHRLSARQSRGPDPLDPRKALAARRRRHVRAGPRSGVDVRRGAPLESLCRRRRARRDGPGAVGLMAEMSAGTTAETTAAAERSKHPTKRINQAKR